MRFAHLMHWVPDLDQAIKAYGDLGFPVQRGGQHPGLGTHNAVWRSPPAYLELIGVRDRSEAAVAMFLESGGYDRHLRRVRMLFEQQVCVFSQAVSKYFPEGTCVSRPSGGYVLWIELPKRVDSIALYHAALKEGISISPGPVFSASGKFRNYIRLNCGIRWSDEVDRAILKIGRLCEAQSR